MKFTINTRILEHLGKELITSDEVAISELIKNSYDANASRVNLHFFEHTNLESASLLIPLTNQVKTIISDEMKVSGELMVLEDNGDGMGQEELEKGFFTIGTDIKKRSKENHSYERIPLGEKGIGRLAAQRLSNILFIETTNSISESIYLVKVSWNEFLKQFEKLDEVELKVWEIEKTESSYTRLWFLDLNISFEDFIEQEKEKQLSFFEEETKDIIQLKPELQSALSFLASPFEEQVEDFDVRVLLDGSIIKSKFQTDAIKVAETIHEFKLYKNENKLELYLAMQLKPWFLERVHQRIVGKNSFVDYRKSPLEYTELLLKYKERFEKSLTIILSEDQIKQNKQMNNEILSNLSDILNIEGKVYSFKREQSLASMAVNSAKINKVVSEKFKIESIRKFLNNHNGIKLYRQQFRIATLGDKDSDWLQLQQARTKGQQFFRFELGNTIGFVKIDDPYQSYIKEISSRQDIRKNQHSSSFKDFLDIVFNDYFYNFSRAAYYIAQDIIKEENLIPKDTLANLNKEVDEANQIAVDSREQLKHLKDSVNTIFNNRHMRNEIEQEELQKAVEHLKITSQNFEKNIQGFINTTENSRKLIKQVEHEKTMIELESYNNYKLMANGLITEVITHELHSLLPKERNTEENYQHIEQLKKYILNEQKNAILYAKHLSPLGERFKVINERMLALSDFYSFIEKTFLYKGTLEDFELENIKEFIASIENRFKSRLSKDKVSIEYSSIDMQWKVPRGALHHVFYNLIDNSFYWINKRREKAKYDKSFDFKEENKIKILKQDEKTILYFDTGTGIKQNIENTLFHPLVSGKEKDGRGMGLYIVRELLRSFNAEIELLQDRNQFNNRYIFAIRVEDEKEVE